jgi:serine-type D-Ala-D-Ala carboxypeptidase/endopeptidase
MCIRMIRPSNVICLALLFLVFPAVAAAEDFTEAVHAYLQRCVDAEGINAAIAVGMVDEHGSRIVGYGKLDNGTDKEVDGNTLFEIGSVTKTFTALLLLDMIERGEMRLDDPVAKYLPSSVTMPARNGKEITLLDLATHTSGLPRDPSNLDPSYAINPYADYNAAKLYDFLSGYKLPRDPGAAWEYSNLGVGLLGDVIALKAGTTYESLVVDRICRPLGMDSTRITLSPQLKPRFAMGHNQLGYAVGGRDFGALAGCGALRSSANDMVKYLSANLGLMPSSLTPLMEKTHAVQFRQADGLNMGLAWWNSAPHGTAIVWHGGDTNGYLTFVGLDEGRRRGVVVLASSRVDVDSLGEYLLECEWRADHRPAASTIDSDVYGSYVGQYQRSPDCLPGMPRMRHLLLGASRAAIGFSAAFGLAILVVLLCWAGSIRKRWIIPGGAVLAACVLATLIAVASNREVGAPAQSGIGISRQGDRLIAQATGLRIWPVDIVLPPGTGELLPESETRYFERLSGASTLTFLRDGAGKVTGLTADYRGLAFSYQKISAQPPNASEPLHPRVPVRLAAAMLDACAGSYEFAPSSALPAGAMLTIRRDGDQLVSQVWISGVSPGAINIYPESPTSFFLEADDSQWTFIKNDKGEVTAVEEHPAGSGELEGKKLRQPEPGMQ